MTSSLENAFDSHVSFNVFSGPVQKVCVLLEKEKTGDYEEKMSTLAQKSLQICLWLAVALTSKCNPDLSPSFCSSALQGPFDSPKGKTCQKQSLLCWCSGLQNSLLLLLPFISVIHPSLLQRSRHSSVVSHESYRWELCVSLCTWPLLTSSLHLLISPLHCSKLCCLKPNPGDCLIED